MEANAAELGHIINQISLTATDKSLLSQFLKRDDKETIDAYNLKLTKFKRHLETIPNSEEFIKALKPITYSFNYGQSDGWQRHYPIEKTPKTHLIHAEYIRLPPKYMVIYGDPYRGIVMPDIFYRTTNVMGYINDKIEGFTKIYYIIKPFGYNFPDVIEADGMTFKFIELYNPQYICLTKRDSKYKGLPMPIIVDGKSAQPMSNAEYTLRYRALTIMRV